MANSDNKVFDFMSAADKTAVFMDDSQLREEQYTRKLSGLSYKDVKDTDMESDWLDLQGQLYGTVSEEKRNVVQRKADELYQSGPLGTAATVVADILPGIPFVDIIDPPEELSEPGMQQVRNILNLVGVAGGLLKTPQAFGRVATNIREPWGYGGSIKSITKHLRDKSTIGKAKKLAKSVIKDEPIYPRGLPKNLIGWGMSDREYLAASDAREFLYRKMFGLKPRRGKNIFKENKDGTLSFNPKSARAQLLIDDVIYNEYTPHKVMGQYSRKELGKGKVQYEDIWDFKMNPSDWSRVFNAIKRRDLGEIGMGAGQAAVRSLVHLITKPSHIKEIEVNAEDSEKDYWLVRKNMKELIKQGEDAIDGILNVAIQGDAPRAYEVAAQMIKTVSEVNKDLMELHKKVKEIKREDINLNQHNTTNQSIYVGSTSDLQDLINQERSRKKAITKDVTEIVDGS